jgi:hypothetical protein
MKTNMHVRFPFARKCLRATLMLVLMVATLVHAQITPSQDAYTDTAHPTTNYGAAITLGVANTAGSIQTSYIQFDLSSIPSGYTGSNVAKATLKLYVNSLTTAGSFNVDFVNGSWSENKITANLAPALGSTIAASVPLASANKNGYLTVDVTSALQAWLNGSQANDGIALVANNPLSSTFDSNENIKTSHPAELDVVFASGNGTITGVKTAAGSGLTGGGTSGTLNLSLLTSCAANQVLQWNGTGWACSSTGTGTITGVTAGTDLAGGGGSGNVTLNLDTTKVPQLNTANTFTQPLAVTATVNSGAGTITGTNTSQYFGTTAVQGNATFTGTGSTIGVSGYSQSTTGWGVYGIGGAAGVYGGSTVNGVYGQTAGASGAGVYGQNQSGQSGTGSAYTVGSGVWGDGGSASNGVGVSGTADNESAAVFVNNSNGPHTVRIHNLNSGGFPFLADNVTGNGCEINYVGTIFCTGSKNALVPIDGGQRKVALSAIESPKNWFEDFGSEQLSNGAAVITLEPEFAQTVNTDLEYHVFLTPKGDCKGLYVANETSISFEVHELGGVTSSVWFDYRIVALRKNFENIRLADHTNDSNLLKTIKKGTPTHFDINRLIPPKREAPLMRSIAQPTNKK